MSERPRLAFSSKLPDGGAYTFLVESCPERRALTVPPGTLTPDFIFHTEYDSPRPGIGVPALLWELPRNGEMEGERNTHCRPCAGRSRSFPLLTDTTNRCLHIA